MIITRLACGQLGLPPNSVKLALSTIEATVYSVAISSFFSLQMSLLTTVAVSILSCEYNYKVSPALLACAFTVKFVFLTVMLHALPILKWPLVLLSGLISFGIVVPEILEALSNSWGEQNSDLQLSDAIQKKFPCKGIFIFKLANGFERKVGICYGGGRPVFLNSPTGMTASDGIIIETRFDTPEECITHIKNLLPEELKGKVMCSCSGLDDTGAESCNTGRTETIEMNQVKVRSI